MMKPIAACLFAALSSFTACSDAVLADTPGSAAGKTTGLASYYKVGSRTASGERYNPNGFTAAHRKFPFGTRLKVTNLRNGKSVIVRVNDRGPFIRQRVLDLSYGAAKEIGLAGRGVTQISFVVVN